MHICFVEQYSMWTLPLLYLVVYISTKHVLLQLSTLGQLYIILANYSGQMYGISSGAYFM